MFQQNYVPQMRERGAVFPVLLYVDNHRSHYNLAICEKTRELDVILICLHPNATWLYQPCDIETFGPLLVSYGNEVSRLRLSEGLICNKQTFSRPLKSAIQKSVTSPLIMSSFRKSGLSWPLNPDAIDYTKLKTENTINNCRWEGTAPSSGELEFSDKIILDETDSTGNCNSFHCNLLELTHIFSKY